MTGQYRMLPARAQDHRLQIGCSGNFAHVVEVARIQRETSEKTSSVISAIPAKDGQRRRISAGFASETHLLAPLAFLLKSRSLRQFLPQHEVGNGIQRQICQLTPVVFGRADA